jgi:two-component sensor histidine kinase
MAIVNDGVRTLLGADGAALVLRDGAYCQYGTEEILSPLWHGRRLPMNACLTGWCMLNRQPAVVPDITQHSRLATEITRPNIARSMAVLPVGRDEPIGALGVYWSEERHLQHDELELLQTIADVTALAMARVRLQQAEAFEGRPAETPVPVAGITEPRPSAPPGRSLGAVISRISREGPRHNSPEAYVIAVLCVLGATLARGLGDASLAPFATYYPAVVLSALAGGRWPGVLAAVLSGLAADWFFLPPRHEFVLSAPAQILTLTLFMGACALIVLIIDRYQHAILRLKVEEAGHFNMAREQVHRLKNAGFVAELIVRESLQDQPERARTINRRIHAGLTDVHLQDEAFNEPVTLRDLLDAELEVFDLAKFSLEGEDDPKIANAKARTILAMAVHELAINAIKYGALSVAGGRVTVGWRLLDGRLTILWREAGGPPVRRPRKLGFGSTLLRRLVAAGGGEITMDFRPSGLAANLSCTLDPVRRDLAS